MRGLRKITWEEYNRDRRAEFDLNTQLEKEAAESPEYKPLNDVVEAAIARLAIGEYDA